jgi:hypothetical protein
MSAVAGRRLVQLLLLAGLVVGAYLALSAFDHAARADDSVPVADRRGLVDQTVRDSRPRVGAGRITATPRAAKAHPLTGSKASPARAEKPVRMDKPEAPTRVEKPVRADKPTRVEKPVRADKPTRVEKPVRADKPTRAEKPVRTGKTVQAEKAVPPKKSVRAGRPVRVELPVRAAKPALLTIRKQQISAVVEKVRTVRPPVVVREATTVVLHLTGHTVPAAVATLPGMLSGVPTAGPDFSVMPVLPETRATSTPASNSSPARTPASARPPAPAPVLAPAPVPGFVVMGVPQATVAGVESPAAPVAGGFAARPHESEDGPRPAPPPRPDSPCATASPSRDAGGGTAPMGAGPTSWWPGFQATAVPPSTNASITGRSVRYCGPPS